MIRTAELDLLEIWSISLPTSASAKSAHCGRFSLFFFIYSAPSKLCYSRIFNCKTSASEHRNSLKLLIPYSAFASKVFSFLYGFLSGIFPPMVDEENGSVV